MKITAITWTSIAVAIAGIMTALKNEIIFLDGFTGLYNRMYLEFLQNQFVQRSIEQAKQNFKEENERNNKQ